MITQGILMTMQPCVMLTEGCIKLLRGCVLLTQGWSAYLLDIAAADQRCITSPERAGASCRRDGGRRENEEQAAIKGCSTVSQAAELEAVSC
jgi:hypothetical protein